MPMQRCQGQLHLAWLPPGQPLKLELGQKVTLKRVHQQSWEEELGLGLLLR